MPRRRAWILFSVIAAALARVAADDALGEDGSGEDAHDFCAQEDEAEHHEAAEECEGKNGFMCFNTCDNVYLIAPIVMILGLLSFGVELLLERAKDVHSHIKEVMTNELAAAGTVSFLLFLLCNGQKQFVRAFAPEKDTAHFRQFQEATELTHMLLLLTVLFFLLSCAILLRAKRRIVAEWRRAREQVAPAVVDEDALVRAFEAQSQSCAGRASPWLSRFTRAVDNRFFLYRNWQALKVQHADRHFPGEPPFKTGLPADFDHIGYLERRTDDIIVRLLRLGPRVWLAMIVGFWLVFLFFNIAGWADGAGKSAVGSQPFCLQQCDRQLDWAIDAHTGCDCDEPHAEGAAEARGSGAAGHKRSRLCTAFCEAATEPAARVLVGAWFKNRALMYICFAWSWAVTLGGSIFLVVSSSRVLRVLAAGELRATFGAAGAADAAPSAAPSAGRSEGLSESPEATPASSEPEVVLTPFNDSNEDERAAPRAKPRPAVWRRKLMPCHHVTEPVRRAQHMRPLAVALANGITACARGTQYPSLFLLRSPHLVVHVFQLVMLSMCVSLALFAVIFFWIPSGDLAHNWPMLPVALVAPLYITFVFAPFALQRLGLLWSIGSLAKEETLGSALSSGRGHGGAAASHSMGSSSSPHQGGGRWASASLPLVAQAPHL